SSPPSQESRKVASAQSRAKVSTESPRACRRRRREAGSASWPKAFMRSDSMGVGPRPDGVDLQQAVQIECQNLVCCKKGRMDFTSRAAAACESDVRPALAARSARCKRRSLDAGEPRLYCCGRNSR